MSYYSLHVCTVLPAACPVLVLLANVSLGFSLSPGELLSWLAATMISLFGVLVRGLNWVEVADRAMGAWGVVAMSPTVATPALDSGGAVAVPSAGPVGLVRAGASA